MHVLTILTGKFAGKFLRLNEGENMVGRDEGVKIRIASAEISRNHCVLMPRPDGTVLVRDLESRNGTFVDGKPIEGDAILKPGETLSIGPMTFQLAAPAAAKAPAKKEIPVLASKPTAPPVPAKPANSPPAAKPTAKISEDEIAGWLDDTTPSASDTTIVTSNSPFLARRKRKTFLSIAEEAADIVRRHHEMHANRIEEE